MYLWCINIGLCIYQQRKLQYLKHKTHLHPPLYNFPHALHVMLISTNAIGQ